MTVLVIAILVVFVSVIAFSLYKQEKITVSEPLIETTYTTIEQPKEKKVLVVKKKKSEAPKAKKEVKQPAPKKKAEAKPKKAAKPATKAGKGKVYKAK